MKLILPVQSKTMDFVCKGEGCALRKDCKKYVLNIPTTEMTAKGTWHKTEWNFTKKNCIHFVEC